MAQPDRPQMTIKSGGCACWITKATDTHSEYAIRIAFRRNMVMQTRLSITIYLCSRLVVFSVVM